MLLRLQIDKNHIRLKAPNNSGSLWYNYKEYYSSVPLALEVADYKFIAINIGSFGREGEAGNGPFNIPPPKKLPATDIVHWETKLLLFLLI